MTKAQDDLLRMQLLLDRATGKKPPSNNYTRVSWHSKQKRWRVKVKKSGAEFYKEFYDEEIAAWVADCAALLIHGRDGAYDRDNQYCLNFPWQKTTPPCPDTSIVPLTVYEWILEQNVPMTFKPSSLPPRV